MVQVNHARLVLLLLVTLCWGCAEEKRAAAPPPPPLPESAPAETVAAESAPATAAVPAPARMMREVARPIEPQHPIRAAAPDASIAAPQITKFAPPPVPLQPTPTIGSAPQADDAFAPRPKFAPIIGSTDTKNAVVEVFYGTNRRGLDRAKLTTLDYLQQFRITALVALIVAVIVMVYQLRLKYRAPAWLTILGGSAITVAFVLGVLGSLQMSDEARRIGRVYGNQRGELEWGKCEVSIPHGHDPGALETPSIVKFEFREDPDRHVILQQITRLEERSFYSEIARANQASQHHDMFVFVHGFNTTFSDAARRTAQLAYDLPYTGTPLMFTWPSQGRPDPIAYTTDGTTADWSASDLENFLDGLLVEFGPERLNLVAHSMGNRVMTAAVRQLAARGRINGKLREIILAAPDVDALIFRRDLAPALVKVASRVTLYASATDEALKFSRRLNGAPRAGDTGELLVLVPGIDTIDVSEVDTTLLGHAYYGSNTTVLGDLFYLLTRNLPAEQRFWLVPQQQQGMRYWQLKRQTLEESAARLKLELRR